MDVTVGTFNLNNLFDRFNFEVDVAALPARERDVRTTFRWDFVGRGDGDGDGDPVPDPVVSSTGLVRFQRNADGRLINAKPERAQQSLAQRIDAMDVDVLAVQEVENRDALQEFNRNRLARPYPYEVLLEGNDARFIDVGVLSRLPLANLTSHRFETHPGSDGPIFSRDLLQVDVLNPTRRRRLFTLFVNHLKSKFVPFNAPDPRAAAEAADRRRRQQAETIARVVAARTRTGSRFIVLGDMNDSPHSEQLAPLRDDLGLVDGLAAAVESRPPPPSSNPVDVPGEVRWSSRHVIAGGPDQFELLDQIWLSPSLAARLAHAQIERRPRWTPSAAGVGSDHDPVWVRLRGL